MPRAERPGFHGAGGNGNLWPGKTAYHTALDAGITAACANKTFQKAFTIGKKVRTESQIHAGATSVGSVAVELAEQIFGDLSGTRVLILGRAR